MLVSIPVVMVSRNDSLEHDFRSHRIIRLALKSAGITMPLRQGSHMDKLRDYKAKRDFTRTTGPRCCRRSNA